MLVWTLVVQLYTGQLVTIDMADEKECRMALERSKTQQMTITMKNGIVMPVSEAFECVMRRKPEGEGGGVS
jgi:hypothetical protein